MKITVDDPGTHKAQVFLNGAEIKHAVIADDEAGYVVQFALNEDGPVRHRLACLEPKPDFVLQFEGCVCEVLTGKVEIRGVFGCPHCKQALLKETDRCPYCERLIG